MNKFFKPINTVLFMFFISAVLIFSVQITCFNLDFYQDQYAKLDTANKIGISQEQLLGATNVLLGYLQEQQETIDFKAQINETEREVFNEREKTHMVDVKNLYQNAVLYKNLVLTVVCFWLVGIALFARNRLKLLPKTFFWAVGLFALLIIGLGIFALMDFNTFWTNFHVLFFSNDLWLLNPNTDIMLMMVPEEFFFALVLKIVITFMLLLGAISLLLILALVLGRKTATNVIGSLTN